MAGALRQGRAAGKRLRVQLLLGDVSAEPAGGVDAVAGGGRGQPQQGATEGTGPAVCLYGLSG
jgi:hypothetical protein